MCLSTFQVWSFSSASVAIGYHNELGIGKMIPLFDSGFHFESCSRFLLSRLRIGIIYFQVILAGCVDVHKMWWVFFFFGSL